MSAASPLAERYFRRFMDAVCVAGAVKSSDARVLRGTFYAGLYSALVLLEEGGTLAELHEEFQSWGPEDAESPVVRQ